MAMNMEQFPTHEAASGDELIAIELSYREMSLDLSGKVISKETKESRRKQFGYCLTCPGIPILLYDIRRSRLNPLWSSKTPRSCNGESLNAVCLKCNPALDSHRSSKSSSAGRRSSACGSESSLPTSLDSGGSNHSGGEEQQAEKRRVMGLRRSSISNSAHPAIVSRSSHDGSKHRSRRRASISNGSHNETSLRSRSDHPSAHLQQQQYPQRKSRSSHQTRSHGSLDPLLNRNSERSGPRRAASDMPSAHKQTSSSSGGGQQLSSSLGSSPMERSARLRRSSPQERSCLARTNSSDRGPRSTLKERGGSGRSGRRSSISHTGSGSLHLPAPSSSDSSGRGGRSMIPSHSQRSSFSNHSRSVRSTSVERQISRSCSNEQAAQERVAGERTLSRSYSNELSAADSSLRGLSTRGRESVDGDAASNGSDDIVNNIRPFLEDLQEANSYDVLADILMNSLDSHCTSEKMQVFCMRKIVECSKKNMDFATKLVEANCSQQILRAMKVFTNSIEVQKRSCDALAALSVVEGSRPVLIRSGTCVQVSKTIGHHISDISLVGRAIRVLRILSLEADARIILQRIDASAQVVEAMDLNLSSASIQRDGCALLSNLAVEPEHQEVSIVDKNILDVVIRSMKAHAGNKAVVTSACFALKNLTYQETNLRTLRRVDSVYEILQHAGQNGDGTGVQDADLVLERILISKAQDDTLEQEGYEALIALVDTKNDHSDIVGEVMNTLHRFSWSSRLVGACFKILRSFASKSEVMKLQITSNENLAELGAVMKAFEKDQTVQNEARELSRVLYGEHYESSPRGVHNFVPIRAENRND